MLTHTAISFAGRLPALRTLRRKISFFSFFSQVALMPTYTANFIAGRLAAYAHCIRSSCSPVDLKIIPRRQYLVYIMFYDLYLNLYFLKCNVHNNKKFYEYKLLV